MLDTLLLSGPVLVQRFAAAARASAGRALNFTVGSLWLALADANKAVALWLQWLILIVLRQTRAATSIGAELDTWCADFGFTRLPAVAAVGQVTLARYTAGIAAYVPVGTTVRTADGTQSYLVTADSTNAAWTGAGYALGPSVLSVTVPVAAATAGSAGNVQAGTVSVLTTALSGVDTVTNAAPLLTGLDAETDADMRSRFVLFVDSRSRGTVGAVGYAIRSLRQGLTYALVDGYDTGGSFRPGFFTVTVDDGSGSPPSSLISQVYTAIDAVRPVGTSFAVVAPTVVTATISLTLTSSAGYSHAALIAQVQAAILAYVDGLGIGAPLRYGQLYRVAYDASPGVVGVNALLLNGGIADVGGGASQVVRATVNTVAVA